MISFDANEKDLYYDCRDQLHMDLRRRAEAALAIRQNWRDSIQTLDDLAKYETGWRANFERALGGLPTEKSPLNARVTGVTECENFTVERLIFESLPNFYVTAACYVPKNLRGSAPAVLVLQGHVPKPWHEYQYLCGALASAGFIALMVDPIGQGERSQYYSGGRYNLMSVNTEHNQAGCALFLKGQNLARYEAWDAIRALDYLETRADVDDSRIGATGHSGGGWQTLLLMATDSRLAAAAPCAVVTTLHWIMKSAEPIDAEHILPRAMVDGPDYMDLLTAMAPRPVACLATSYDRYFPFEGTLEAADWARRVYELHGRPENFELIVDDSIHTYTKHLREQCVHFFRRRFLGAEDFLAEPELPLLAARELQATRSGQVVVDFPSAKTITDLTAEIPCGTPPDSVEELRAAIDEVLGISRAGDRSRPIYPRLETGLERDGYPLEKLQFFSAPEIWLTALICHPRGELIAEPLPTVILLIDGGTSAAPANRDKIQFYLARRKRVVVLDVRGTGAVAARRRVPLYQCGGWSYLGDEYNNACDALHLGLTLLGLRVFDVLRCLDYLVTRPDVAGASLHGVGQGAFWAYFAGAVETRFEETVCEELLTSYAELAGEAYFDNGRFGLGVLPFGVVGRWDLEGVAACFGGRYLQSHSRTHPSGLLLT